MTMKTWIMWNTNDWIMVSWYVSNISKSRTFLHKYVTSANTTPPPSLWIISKMSTRHAIYLDIVTPYYVGSKNNWYRPFFRYWKRCCLTAPTVVARCVQTMQQNRNQNKKKKKHQETHKMKQAKRRKRRGGSDFEENSNGNQTLLDSYYVHFFLWPLDTVPSSMTAYCTFATVNVIYCTLKTVTAKYCMFETVMVNHCPLNKFDFLEKLVNT